MNGAPADAGESRSLSHTLEYASRPASTSASAARARTEGRGLLLPFIQADGICARSYPYPRQVWARAQGHRYIRLENQGGQMHRSDERGNSA